MSVRYHVVLPPGAVEVFALDDPGKWPGSILAACSRRSVMFEATLDQIVNLLGEADARCSGGWDQPLWYSRTARAVRKRISHFRGRAWAAETELNGPSFVEHRADDTETWSDCQSGFCSYPYHRAKP